MSLHDTQTAFKTMMIERHIESPEAIFHQGGMSLQKRMGTYKNNYSAGLSDVLAGTFQTITALVGEKFMHGVCARFVRAHPPQKACMHDYGEALPAFLENFEPAQSMPYLPDMARLDWAANTAYHADNVTAITPENLSDINFNENDFRLHLHPSVTLLSSPYPINDLRAYVRDSERQKTEEFNVTEKETFLLVSRQQGQVYIQGLTPAEHSFIQSLQPLTIAVEETLVIFPDFNFQEILQKTLSCETFLDPDTNNFIDTYKG